MLVVLALVGALVYVGYSAVRDPAPPSRGDLPFEGREAVFGARRGSLGEFLRRAAGEEYVVLSMVPLSAVVRVKAEARPRAVYERIADGLSVPHLLCEASTGRPVAAVFASGDEVRSSGGVSVGAALSAAGVRVVVVEAMESYPCDGASARALMEAIRRKLGAPPAGSSSGIVSKCYL